MIQYNMYISLSLSIYIYIYAHMCIHIHIYIYICMYTYIHIYTCIVEFRCAKSAAQKRDPLAQPANCSRRNCGRDGFSGIRGVDFWRAILHPVYYSILL